MKVVVVGGGLIGMGVAWRAAARGLDVCLLDDAPERAASRVGAGLLIPAGGRISRNHLALRMASATRYPSFVEELLAETGLDSGYNPCGTLTVAYPPKADAALDGLHGCLVGLGVDSQRLDTNQSQIREPALAGSVVGGLVTPDHQVDSHKLLLALEEACLGRNVEFVSERALAVTEHSVTLGNGQLLDCDRVVVATGAWISDLLELPVYPVKGEVLELRGPHILKGNLRLQKQDLYVANRGDGRLVIGSTEEEVGFEATPKGHEVLLHRARQLLPALVDFEVTDHRVGFRPKVADGLPLLGEYEGIVVAGAHYRNGILLAPITADLISDYLVSGETSELMKPFTPTRAIKDRRQL